MPPLFRDTTTPAQQRPRRQKLPMATDVLTSYEPAPWCPPLACSFVWNSGSRRASGVVAKWAGGRATISRGRRVVMIFFCDNTTRAAATKIPVATTSSSDYVQNRSQPMSVFWGDHVLLPPTRLITGERYLCRPDWVGHWYGHRTAGSHNPLPFMATNLLHGKKKKGR
jgi:hypothetical protein